MKNHSLDMINFKIKIKKKNENRTYWSDQNLLFTTATTILATEIITAAALLKKYKHIKQQQG